MDLKSSFHQELTARQGPSAGSIDAIEIAADRGTVRCELLAVDSIGCAFRLLEVSSDALRGLGIDQLKTIGESLAIRLNYLLEPIRPIEIDKDACIIQLRSMPPAKGDQGTSYYELIVQPGRIGLQRFNKQPSNTRQSVPANVTREVLARLASDMHDAVP